MNLEQVVIGIQARSDSTRFPGKCYEMIGGKRSLDHTIDICINAANWLNKAVERNRFFTRVALVIPKGDEIGHKFHGKIQIIEGSKDDVLSRYLLLAHEFNADYIVRITGDCPRLPPFIISRLISLAVSKDYDYISNCDERIRTTIDGHDCEVFSKEALEYLHDAAKDQSDREHVTTLIRRSPPTWALMATALTFNDFSDYKSSVDTPEDLERVRNEYASFEKKHTKAVKLYGKNCVHFI